MSELTDNNGWLVARGSRAKLMDFVKRQRDFDPTVALWLDGVRVL